MPSLRTLLAAWIASLPLVGGTLAASEPGPVALAHVRLIDGGGGPPVDDAVIVASAGRIVAVEPAGTAIPEGATVRDLRGKAVVPGFISVHSHVGQVRSGSAELLGLNDRGRIEPGRRAGLIILGSDPSTDIENARSIREVWVQGRACIRP